MPPRLHRGFISAQTFLGWTNLLVVAGVVMSLGCASHPDPLYQAFYDPTPETRPFVRWWWNGSRINADEIVRELDVMEKAGIGGVEINTIGMPDGIPESVLERHPARPWLSPEWIQMIQVATHAARERGMTADLIVGSGWPFGGRFLTAEEQTQRVLLVKHKVTGPAVIDMTTAQLATAPTDAPDQRRSDRAPVPTDSRLVFLRLLPGNVSPHVFNAGVDLMPQIGDAANLSVEVPDGDHLLYAGVWQAGFTHVKLGAPGADGPVVNHFDAGAVKKYLDHMSGTLAPALGGDLGNALRATFVDSLELDHANWTGDLPIEFRHRRGYDLMPYLPFVLENDDPDQDNGFIATVRRVRYDYLKTLIELFDERFVRTYVAWAEKNRVKARIQAYGRETHPLHGSMVVHLPEGETWLWVDKENKDRIGVESTVINKYVASAANLTGQRLRSFEAMTNAVPVFRETLQDFKRGMDASVLSGVNHPIIHGFNYTPPDAGFPGWVRYGCYLNERTPWWPFFRRFSDYAARLSTIMRSSDAQARVAVLAPRPEEWAHHGLLYQPFPEVHHPWYQYKLTEAIHQNGYGADYISEKILTEARFKNGSLYYGPRRYDLLVLEDIGAMEPAAANAVKRFAQAGGKIVFIGKAPVRAPGFHDADKKDAAVRAAIATARAVSESKVRLVESPTPENLLHWTGQTLATMGLEPDVVLQPTSPHLSQVHHRIGQRAIYFLSNSHTENPVRFTARFRAAIGRAWAWDLETGLRRSLGFSANEDVALNLDPLASLLIVFEPNDIADKPDPLSVPLFPPGTDSHTIERQVLNGPWQVTLDIAGGGGTIERQLDDLVDLSQQDDDPQLFRFGGVAHYRKTVEVGPQPPAALDLGIVHGVSEVVVNGQPVGVTWWGRHVHDLRGVLRPGKNQIEIRVATVLANLMKHRKDDRMAQRWASWAPPIAAGLVGPVRLVDVSDQAPRGQITHHP